MSKPFTLQFSISAADHGLLLREFLIQNHISRTALTDIKYHGGKILVNGSEETVRYVLQEHDIITIQFPPEEKNGRMQGVQIPLHIVYEDDYILVVEKPSAMSTIPSREHPEYTLANAIVYYYSQIGLNSAVHFVTRLDYDTSGLVLVAKHRHIHHLLSLAQEKNEITKEYLALIRGTLKTQSGRIDQPIARVNNSIIKREVRADGQTASTIYRTLRSFQYQEENCSLVRLQLLTGRTHQIRVHLEWLGHPLLGDSLYGGDCTHIQRQALHCAKLQFTHPVSGRLIHLESPLPPDLQTLLPPSHNSICDKTNMHK